jgi:hypothetical protein
MKAKRLILIVGIPMLLAGLSLLARGQFPVVTGLTRTLMTNSVGEVVVGFEYTAPASLAQDPVPLIGNPPRTVIVKSGGEVVAHVALTNRARVSLPTGRFQMLEGVGSVTYRGDGLLTVEIVSARGHAFKLVAEEIELVW